MARQPRLDLPGIPQHVVQRGNNRLPCFLDDNDRRRYLHLLGEALLDTGCALHAYVLMDNHVHLLLTPPEAGAISRLMQKLGRGYVGQFNARHRRTGTLWEGRYKSCLVDNEDYVLRCYRYIDLNPVRARMTDSPIAYAWSSASAHCGHRTDLLLRHHPAYAALGAAPDARGEAYRGLAHVPASERLHERRHLPGRRRRQKQVHVIGHQHVGMHGALAAQGKLVQFLQIAQVVGLLEETGLTIVAPLHHMLRYPWQIESWPTWHGRLPGESDQPARSATSQPSAETAPACQESALWHGFCPLGQPVVPNGIPLSKLHHAAFDAHLIGIDPDFRMHVSTRLLEQKDGPMLEAIKQLDKQTIRLPPRLQDRPDRDRLAMRYEVFRARA